jgi:hypothetical protein
VSHFDAGQVSRPDLVNQTLDLGGIFDSLIDRLDEWVERDVAPTASKIDAVESADKNNNGANGRVQSPCLKSPVPWASTSPPAGSDPGRRGGQETAFAAFDGVNQEPLMRAMFWST